MPHPCRRIQPLGQPSRSRDARGTTIDGAKAGGLPPSDIRSLHFVPRQAHLALQGTRSALIGAGGLSTGGTGIGVGGSSIGLGSCGSGRTGGLPGGLGFPGCPPMSKLRSDFAPEKTPGSPLRFRTTAIKALPRRRADGERGAHQQTKCHTVAEPRTGMDNVASFNAEQLGQLPLAQPFAASRRRPSGRTTGGTNAALFLMQARMPPFSTARCQARNSSSDIR